MLSTRTPWKTAAIAALLTVVAVVFVPPARASERRPLPAAVVTTAEGVRADLASLGADGRWLVVVVDAGSAVSTRLVEAIGRWQVDTPDLGERVVVVVTAPLDEARAFVATAAGDGATVRSAADVDGSAAAALRVPGVPTIMGVDAGEIVWVLSGVLNDPATVKDVVVAWARPLP